MKQRVFFIVLLFLFLSRPITQAQAACVIGSAKKVQVNITFQSQGESGSTLTIPGKFKSFHRNKPQCTTPNESSPTVVSCDEETESLAADSLFAPLCGAGEERGKANSTCWQCEGDMRCDGADYAVGETDDFLFLYRQSIDGSPTDQVWRVPDDKIQATFKYNGITYPKSGGLVVCGSNNLACGANPDEYYCKNIPHQEIDNRGNSGSEDQCQDPVGLGAGNFTIAEPSCNGNSQPVDILSYVGACKSGECSKSQASVFTKTDSFVNTVSNQVVWTDANNFTLKTNDKEIKYTVRGGSVYMTEDHTWENEQKCDNGNPAFQRPYTMTNGVRTEGIALYKPEMTCGQTVSGKTALEAFDATTGSACTNGIATNSQSNPADYSVRLMYQGRAVCGGQSQDILAFQNTAGPGTGEVYIYSKDKGLTAWYQGMDFTKGTNNPKNWGATTDVCSGTFSSAPACAVQSKPQTTGLAPIYGAVDFGEKCHGTKGLICFAEKVQAEILGKVYFEKNKIKQQFKTFDIRRYANWFMAASPLFTPSSLQKTEKGLNPFLGYASGTLSVDSDDQSKPNCHEVKQGVINFPLPDWHKFVWKSDFFNAFLGPYGARPDLNFRRDFPQLYLKERDTRGCPEQSPFTPVKEIEILSSNEYEYEANPATYPIYKAAIRALSAWEKFKNVFAQFGFCKDCDSGGAYTWFANFHFLTPHAEVTADNFAVNKNNERKGWGLAFLPNQYEINYKNAGTLANEVAHPLLGNPEPSYVDAPFEGVEVDFEMAKAVLCSITPWELHGKSNIDCKGLIGTDPNNDVAPGRPLDGGTDPGFSGASLGSDYSTFTNGKIPACVLEAVKYIETGTRTDFSGTCRVNECSAAGPFQVTTGAAPAPGGGWDTHCKQCGPSWADGSRTCPDGWTNSNWPQTPTDPSPCEDVNAAANRAVQMLQEKAEIRCEKLDPITTRSIQDQKTAIITAAGSYFGKNNPIDKYGGCSYGEFVYKHCDGSYLCGTANVDLDVKYEQCQKQRGL